MQRGLFQRQPSLRVWEGLDRHRLSAESTRCGREAVNHHIALSRMGAHTVTARVQGEGSSTLLPSFLSWHTRNRGCVTNPNRYTAESVRSVEKRSQVWPPFRLDPNSRPNTTSLAGGALGPYRERSRPSSEG